MKIGNSPAELLLLPMLLPLLLLTGCQPEAKSSTGDRLTDVTLTENLTIEGEEENIEEFLMQPIDAGENSRYIYIADRQQRCIVFYNSEGEFVKKIGRRGNGPGEFGVISEILVDDNELLVMDDEQMRISRFTVEGELESIHLYSELGIIVAPTDILKLESGNYVIVYGNRSSATDDPDFYKSVMHEVSSGFTEIISSFGSKETIFGGYDEYSNFSDASAGQITRIGDSIIFAPRVYSGTIYVYEKEGGEWINTTTLENSEIITPPVELLSHGNSRHEKANFRGFQPDGSITNYYISTFSQELGAYGESRIVHFLSADHNGEEKRQMLEVFSLDTGALEYFDAAEVRRTDHSATDLSLYNINLLESGNLYEIVIDSTIAVNRYALEW